jgi:hypothetical protein
MSNLSPKQTRAVQFIADNPRSTVDEICNYAGVSPAFNNRAEFIARLINKGVVYLTPDDRSEWE